MCRQFWGNESGCRDPARLVLLPKYLTHGSLGHRRTTSSQSSKEAKGSQPRAVACKDLTAGASWTSGKGLASSAGLSWVCASAGSTAPSSPTVPSTLPGGASQGPRTWL